MKRNKKAMTSNKLSSAYQFCSISTCSLNRYPDNRLTKFTHHLPETLTLHPKKRYVIRVLSLCLSSARLPQWAKPSYVKVHLAQLDVNGFASSDRSRCVAQLVLPNTSENLLETVTTLDWFQFNNPASYTLDPTLSRLTDLSFEFTDENNKELHITQGPPTILNCVIEEMENVDRFSLTLNPSLSKQFFPTNTDSDFRTTFGSPIASGNNWEVALHSVIVPSQMRVLGEFFEFHVGLKGGGSTHKRIKNHGQNADFVIDHFQTELATLGIYIMRKDKDRYVVEFEMPHKRTESMGEILSFNPSLCALFNIPHYASDLGVSFKADTPELQRIFPFASTFDPEKTMNVAEQIVLFADMVQTSVIGDERAPLVDILSTVKLGMLENEPGADTLYTIPQPTFRHVAKANIKDIRVRITDIHGKPATFEYSRDGGKKEMQFVFVFRRIK